jgi:hypothetical protein
VSGCRWSSRSSAWAGDTGATDRRAARIGTAVALVVFVLLATGGQPWHAFDRGPFTSDFYDAQARALSRGHLDVSPDVAGIEGFVVGGRTYFYYGIVPALARVPVSAFTHALDGRLVLLSMSAALVVGCLAAARLLQRGRAAVGAAVAARAWPWITGVFAAAVGLSSPLLWLSSRTLIYHEAELWGAALAVLGFERIIVWWESRDGRDLVGASVVAALALSTRGSSGIGPTLALGGLAVILAWDRAWRPAAAAVAAAAVPVAAYALVNVMRFGTPFQVPFDRQILNDFSASRRAALAANHDTLFGLKFLPSGLLQYLRPDTVTPRALAPWLSWNGRADVIGDVTFDTVDRAASLPVAAPALLVAAIVGAVAIVRRRLPASWGITLLAAAAAVVPTLSIAFIAQRYLADFVPILVVGACVGVPVVAAWAADLTTRRRVVTAATAVLLAVGLTVNAGLALLARYVYLLPTATERRDFVATQYEIQERVGGGRPPAVVEVAALGPPAADGVVAIVGDCDGLYRSDGSAWVLLEQRAGGSQRAVVRGDTPGPVVSGDGWQLVLEEGDGGRRLAYVGPVRVEGPPTAGNGPIVVDVSADSTIPTVVVRVDDRPYLVAFLRSAGGSVVAAPGWQSEPAEASLCASLERRLR